MPAGNLFYMMLEHLQADGAGGAEQGPETGKHVPHEREMASTLAALAAAAPASGASGEPSGCGPPPIL